MPSSTEVPEGLLVHLSREARLSLEEAANEREVGGASDLAREILERWIAGCQVSQIGEGVQRAVAYLVAHPDWPDELADSSRAPVDD